MSVLLQASAAPDMEQKVSFTSRGADLGQIVSELSTKTGVPMRMAAGTMPIQLVIQVRDVPLKDLIARINDASLTDSGMSSGILYFSPSEKRLNGLAEEARQGRVALLQKWRKREVQSLTKVPMSADGIRELRNAFETPSETPGAERDYMTLYSQMPMRAVASEIVLSLPDIELASVNAYGRQVFSTSPTRMQGRLDIGVVNRALRKYADAINMWQSVDMEGAGDDPETLKEIRRREFAIRNAVAARAHLVVTADERMGSGINMELQLFDAKGERLDYPMQGVNINEYENWTEASKPEPGEKAVNVSKEDQDLGKFLTTRFNGDTSTLTPAPAPIVQRFLQPETKDPLSFSAADILFADWDRRKVNGVAAPSDFLGLIPLYMSEGSETVYPSSMLNVIAQSGQAKADYSKAGWAVWKPVSMRGLEMIKSRAELGKFMRNVAAYPTDIESLYSDYQGDAGNWEPYEDMSYIMAMGIFGNAMPGASSRNTPLGRMYRQLSSDQQSSLLRGNAVSVSAINKKALIALERAVYGNPSGFCYLPTFRKLAMGEEGDARSEAAMENQLYNGYGMYIGQTVPDEPTFSMASGVMDGQIMARTNAVPMIAAYEGKTQLAVSPLEGFGGMMMYYFKDATPEDPNRGPWFGKKVKYRLMNNLEIYVRVMFGPDRGVFGVSRGKLVGKDSPLLDYAQLPAAVRKQIEEEQKNGGEGAAPTAPATVEGPPR